MAKSKKTTAAKKTSKKSAPAKKSAAAKKSAPAKKSAAAKKSAPAKKSAAAKKSAPARKRAPAKKPTGIPAGFHTITPNLVYTDTVAAIDWYVKAFGAQEVARMPSPDGKSIWHAEVKFGDSILFLNDESPMGATIAPRGPKTATAGIQLYVSDVDATAQRAIDAGAKVLMPVSDTFWGDRMGVVEDPFGHVWMMSTRTKEMSPREMQEAGEAFAKSMAAASQA
jgi:PhnB protein